MRHYHGWGIGVSKINLPRRNDQSEFVVFSGGLDVTTPAALIPPGFVRRSQNFYEDINGGYASVAGYERFDGQASPSEAKYALLPYSVAGTVAVGDTITGASSAATGVVIAITDTDFILTKNTGTWVTENTTAGGASVVGPAVLNGASGKTGAQYAALAADVYRSDITAVPGEDGILGVVYFNSVVYAFRNEAAPATGVGLYKSTTSGWTAVPLGIEVTFTLASGAEPAEGATITQGGVSGELKRLVIESGTFSGGDAAGRLIFASVTAGPFVAGVFTAGITATCGTQSNITIPNQDGRFEFAIANFSGSVNRTRIYGCDGVNKGFEFDGTVFVPINTGLGAIDKPTHVVDHQNHLFFSVAGSVQHSAIGDPYNWTTTAGGGEIAIGDPVTGMRSQPGSDTNPALAVYSRNKINMIYGTSAADWQRVLFSDDTGGIPYSIQKIGQTYALDDRGLSSLAASQNFGNFADSIISDRVTSWLKTRRSQVTDSHVSRDKQQYRIFFSDGSAAYWTLRSKKASMMPIYFPNPVTCSWSSEITGGGDELIFFGSSNGMVYQMEKGTSFDGANIEAYIELVFNHSKSYRTLKKYRRMTFEMNGSGYAEFKSSYDLSYASSEVAQPDLVNNTINLSAAFWDEFVWDQFIWDGQPLTNLSMSTPGNGENISVRILSNGNYFTPILFSGVFLEFSTLRMLR
jgi:hypothetical protein